MTARRTLNRVRRATYRTGRILGDVNAASRGPGAYARRVVRKKAYRATNRTLRRFLKGLGL